ncbi:uncharacterized protein N7458_011091 [Penicillium daleae]|uniref:Zn(2)-C6 fungal-type domain-containing protein n=1 Tax=Penicillium daleae TaxID=63821 RepID=A0AAD6C1G1_9EURO|nr:uncharacterized protein N7458_011091 [Penicillium daleae]KAJ5440093.1 hypothetical protein N7458_011091 [Penicillium daleae]
MFSSFSADLTVDKVNRPRPKRKQVSRACDWCRLNRIKCDDSQPCQNCAKRGGHCTHNREKESSLSLPAASREIRQLRQQVTKLQEQLNLAIQHTTDPTPAKYTSPPESNGTTQSTTPHHENSQEASSLPVPRWEGIRIPEGRQSALIYYGPLSSPYFADRMSRHLWEKLGELESNHTSLLLDSQLTLPAGNFLLSSGLDQDTANLGLEDDRAFEELSRAQEEYFLDLLWQTFNCIYPIIIEDEFREHYDSLWRTSANETKRHSSTLVDSILAVCMQYGSNFLTSDGHGDISGYHVEAGSRSSYALYSRSQKLILDELETPSLITLQSQVYCAVFLYNNSSLNAAYNYLRTAAGTAETLGLNSQPSDGLPPRERQLHRRIWSTLFTLDSQISMVLGRPPLIDRWEIGHDLAVDSQEDSILSGSKLICPNNEDITWLSFHTQYFRLVSLVRRVQNEFEARCVQLLERKSTRTIYEDPFSLEELAGFLAQKARIVYEWARNVPESLKIPRKGSGEPLSTERTPLNFDQFSPIWLQRQRLVLEIVYHHLQLSTFRTFLRFPPGSSSITPLSDCHSINCLNHAVALTRILHQVLTETDLLRGWSAIFQYQWDAAIICRLQERQLKKCENRASKPRSSLRDFTIPCHCGGPRRETTLAKVKRRLPGQ